MATTPGRCAPGNERHFVLWPAQRATVAHLEPGQSAEKSSRQEHQPGVGIKESHLDPTMLNPAKRVVDTVYLPQLTPGTHLQLVKHERVK